MRIIPIFCFIVFFTVKSIAQVTPAQTMTMAVKYANGDDGGYPRSPFIGGITSEDDALSISAVKPGALFEGATGQERVTASTGKRLIVISKNYEKLEDADKDIAEMMAAVIKIYPAAKDMPQTPANGSVESKAVGVEYGTFVFAVLYNVSKSGDAAQPFKLRILLNR
ncbi:MAG: hypothetical protein ACXVIY_01535 [Mucilaginibacter sp.]